MKRKAFILAGEASGDRLGGLLMQAAKRALGPIDWMGMGGEAMQAEGLMSKEDMQQLSIIGISDVLMALPRLSRLADRLIEQIVTARPEIIFTVDSKAFSVRFAKRLRRRLAKLDGYQPQFIHMVAPTIWAWGAWRRSAFEEAFDVLLCLFPFEPALFDENRVKALFIGHPDGVVFDRDAPDGVVLDGRAHDEEASDGGGIMCKSLETRDSLHLLLLPGSRKSEIKAHLPVLLTVAKRLLARYPDMRFTLPTLPYLYQQIACEIEAQGLGGKVMPSTQDVANYLAQTDFMLAASGSVTLSTAIAGVPGVVIYSLTRLNRLFAWAFFKQPTPVLPDIILGEQFYPFLLSPDLNADSLYKMAIEGIEQLDERSEAMRDASVRLTAMLAPHKQDFVEGLAGQLIITNS